MLKADDLLAMDSSDPRDSSSTTTSVFLRPAENRRPTAIASASKYVFFFQIFLFCLLEYFRERPTTASLDKIKRELITTTATEDGKFFLERAD
jgi:hypothetical protein